MDKEIKPCPYCNGTRTEINPTRNWHGGKNIITGYILTHQCEAYTGYIELRATEKQILLDKWNIREPNKEGES